MIIILILIGIDCYLAITAATNISISSDYDYKNELKKETLYMCIGAAVITGISVFVIVILMLLGQLW